MATRFSFLRFFGRSGAPRRTSRRLRPGKASALTLDGLMFIVLALLIGLSAINTGQNLLYLMLSMMASMLIISFLLARNNLRRLSVRRLYPLEFHAGQAVQGAIEIHNDKRRFYSYAIAVQETIVGPARAGKDVWSRTYRSFALFIPPGRRTSCPLTLNLPVRGLYTIRQACIITRFPFGFFEKMIISPEAVTILVFPRLFPAHALAAHCPHFFGAMSVERKGFGSDIFGIRDYTPGDSARLIHWRLSAKGHGIKAKEFEQEDNRSYRLMLDLRCPPGPAPALLADFEKAVSAAASLARLLLGQGAEVSLWTPLGNVPRGTGSHHLQRMLRALAQVEPLRPGHPLVNPDSSDRGAIEVWFDFLPRDESSFRPEPALRRAPGHHALDVRHLDLPETALDEAAANVLAR